MRMDWARQEGLLPDRPAEGLAVAATSRSSLGLYLMGKLFVDCETRKKEDDREAELVDRRESTAIGAG